ncbi:MAG TPA: acetyl-CoA carboxylase biotin carboxylase subunit [Candidatus Kapabacteria bacterium]|nr:acetyl-CoA carboxylase biotin carboxylase subunit [Candidatus Kapabacteria bacterium]
MLKRVLIANRGEIARRVIRSAHELDVQAVSIYSPHDQTALYVREADEAFRLNGNLPKESYLDQEQVLWAAKESKADAIHPGYGFLSENAAFSEATARAGIIFIGPKPETIDALGDKTKARIIAQRLGVPTPSGTTEALNSWQEAAEVAEKIGYPILLKAAAGGGGKGMRVVDRKEDLASSLERAKGEALSSFGDDRVYVEKYITNPRHIEIQVLADSHRNVIHLGERECSIQRRHQKLVEEAPSSVLTPALRREMGEAAVALVKEAQYTGAGTVEFLVDDKGKYYFLEVNTRLQVEHPVTEFITGLDLVREQLVIASGGKISITQDQVELRGHSIEIRVQAEDIWSGFMPSLGTVSYVRHPGGAFVRNDSALFNGLEVSGFYDSLLSKLIVWDTTRDLAIKRMKRALEEMKVVGVSTTIPFGSFVMDNETFRRGDLSTAFVEREFSDAIRDELLSQQRAKSVSSFVTVQDQVDQSRQRRLFVGAEVSTKVFD